MHIKTIGSTLCFVIFSNCLLSESRSIYSSRPYEFLLAKREIELERRGFLKNFCARRCNIGKGGNVCRCNGYHFAGKRTSNLPTDHITSTKGNQEEKANDYIYKLLLDHNEIALPSDVNKDMAAHNDELLEQILEILPRIMNGDYDSSEQNPLYEDYIADYVNSENI
ncbi:hypothetical protein ACF0H5_011555 [Mactra antiquata]